MKYKEKKNCLHFALETKSHINHAQHFTLSLYLFFFNMSETSNKSALPQEQLNLMATNKAKALDRLREKRKANGESSTEAPPKKAKWIKSFYEYDLSTLVDSKGGYIIDENEGSKKLIEERNKRSFEYEPYYRKNQTLFFDTKTDSFLW